MTHIKVKGAGGAAMGALALAASCTVFNGKTFQDTSGTDGGLTSSDGGPSNVDAGPCGCASSTAIVCEDFETTPSSIWSALDTEAPPPDATHVHCGSKALHLSSPDLNANQNYDMGIGETETFANPRLSSGFFARVWVYVPSGSIAATNNYAAFMQAQQTGGNFLGIGTQISPAAADLTDWTTDPSGFAETASEFPRDTWTCVEWQVVYGASNGSSQMWIGGASASAAQLNDTNTQPSPAYGQFNLELTFETTTAQPAFDEWLDDFVLDSQRIGCQN